MKHKVTKEVLKQIEALASTLPAMQKYKDGKPLSRKLCKRMFGHELPEATKKELQEKNQYVSTGSYNTWKWEPLLVNHSIELISQYKLKGELGINSYVDAINTILQKAEDDKNDNIQK